MKAFTKKYWPLLLVLMIGGFIRLYGLLQNPISFYSDEVDVGYQVFSLVKTGCDYSGNCLPLQFQSFSDMRTPIPIYFTALVYLLGVPLDYAIRLTPALFGLLGILATYLFVENLTSKSLFNLNLHYAGLFSAMVLALVPWHITYSRIGFELTTLYFFVTTGFYFFTRYLIENRNKYLFIAYLFLGLTPLVYSTAKMAIIFYPAVLLLFPGFLAKFKNSLPARLSMVILFIPLAILLFAGGADSRFRYISVFTDPTTPTEVGFSRLLDSGPSAVVGTSPSLTSKFFHNKPFSYAGNLMNNVFGLLSSDFLFVKGDPNLRHSPANSGMLFRSLAPILLIGSYFLIRFRHNRLLSILGLLTLIAISTSAITRDGANHGSRSFMMLLPIVIISGFGIAYLLTYKKVVFSLFLSLMIFEFAFFLHNYWYHYRYDSAGSWSYGMKEVIKLSEKYPGKPIVISPKNENPLIFYAYYTKFDPNRFQQFIKNHTLFNSTEGKFNLDGNRIGDTNLYIATLIDLNQKSANSLPGAIYYLAKLETINSSIRSLATNSTVITLPSGEPLFYEIHF